MNFGGTQTFKSIVFHPCCLRPCQIHDLLINQIYSIHPNICNSLNSFFASLVAQRVKSRPARGETWVRSLGWEDPQEKEMATYPSILAWRIPWTEEPGGLLSIRSQRAGHYWSDLVHTHTAVPTRLRRCAEQSVVSGCHGDKNWRSRAYPGFQLACLNYYIRIWVNHE